MGSEVQFYEEILNSLPDPLMVLDADLKILFANLQAQSLFKKDKQDLLGKSIEEWISHRKVFLARLFDESSLQSVEAYLQCADEEKPILMTVRIISESPRVWSVHLKENVVQKPSEAGLQKKAEMVEASRLQALETFAGGVAHEINNPLAILLGYFQRLHRMATRSSITSEELLTMTGKMQSAALRIGTIVGSLKLLANKGDDESFELVNLKDIVEGALRVSRSRLDERRISVVLRVHEEDMEIRAKPSQISQIFFHLLSNAIDAVAICELQGRSPEIVISIQSEEEWVVISVEDNGVGIPKEIRDEVMLPFFTTKDPGKGAGLGLSVSLRMAKENSGDLYLDENSAHTKFVARFPRVFSLKSFGQDVVESGL